jgi:hypothetical protein
MPWTSSKWREGTAILGVLVEVMSEGLDIEEEWRLGIKGRKNG